MAEGLRITFAFNPDAPFFDRVFTRFTKDMSDLSAAWNDIAVALYAATRDQFTSQGGHGEPWAPLSPAYAAWKARAYPNKAILYRSDILFRAATGDRGVGAKLDIKPLSLTIGIDAHSDVAARARFHQSGTRRMPARPWLIVTEGMKREWTRAIAKRLNEAARTAAAALNSGANAT